MTDRALAGKKVVVISRCAWTMFNFRLPLLRALRAAGAEVIALGAGGDGYEAKLREQQVDFRHVPIAARSVQPLADVRLLFRLVRDMARERPDVVHCFTIKPAIYGPIAAWLSRVPVRMVTITGLGHAFTSAGGLLRRLVTLLYRISLARAHRVYFQNAADRELFVSAGIVAPDRAKVCAGSGVDLVRFAPTRLPAEDPAQPVRFLMIARLIREKGISEYVQAAERVKQRHPAVEFSLLGGEDQRNPSALSSSEVAALRASAAVRWLGETSDVPPYISATDIVVLPSYREGLPRTLLEAGAMGRPVIATDVVGCRDVVVDNVTGFLVAPRDVASLAAAMERMIESRAQLAAMGRAARERVVALFDERAVIDETLADYACLLQARGSDAKTTAAA
jgi:glycosyltransferase involved in cell wall biosynthesis